jgi:hypothetical protein
MTLARRTLVALCIALATALAVVALAAIDEGRAPAGLVQIHHD